ncbi:cyanophycin synthetase [Kytococcus aerolatus]|uniref:Cyanophycin synthetase n=1 Tax=Kytococcus aerolatus TaxID=592308 RepID=A0A212T0W2_9MICO|nr:tetratricopeptide repeat protein [Kytococcus aerolatus]SNC59678.1 cyanophycin synthetase [Kytococcus aerolatus]
MTAPTVAVSEVRLLEGPNLYYTRPAVKVMLRVEGMAEAERAECLRVAELLGLPRTVPGRPGTQQRSRFLVRLARRVIRALGREVGLGEITARGRTGDDPADITVAFRWWRRGTGEAMGRAIGPLLEAMWADPERFEEQLEQAARQVLAADPGAEPVAFRPKVPVVSVTGTNGKTTTTRLLAHIAMEAGRTAAWSSTDGVLRQGEWLVRGDYSGPSGARLALEGPEVEVGILETARGGLLQKGMGVRSNDVSVVTNVSADHLGSHGINTLDQLAEVKGIITRVTRPSGWVVLNADDPRVWDMRHRATGQVWAFSLDPANPALRAAVEGGGRAMTVLDESVAMITGVGDPRHVVPLAEVPMTLGGLSRPNVANVLAAAAAAIGLGLSREEVAAGLRTFQPDRHHNPARMNTFRWRVPDGEATIVCDLAHNEAGVETLLEVARGLVLPGSEVHLTLGGLGDRTDEILEAMGVVAGRGADRTHLVSKDHYLRGREVEEVFDHLRTGLASVGQVPTATWPDEVAALAGVTEMLRDGDVLAFTVHDRRDEDLAWLDEHGAEELSAEEVARLVKRSRGQHELDACFTALAEGPTPERVSGLRELVASRPGDARVRFELARALDAAGEADQAIATHEEALGLGLREPQRFVALMERAMAARAGGRVAEASTWARELTERYDDSAAAAALAALTALDAGRPERAATDAVEWLLHHSTHPADWEFTGRLV